MNGLSIIPFKTFVYTSPKGYIMKLQKALKPTIDYPKRKYIKPIFVNSSVAIVTELPPLEDNITEWCYAPKK